MVRDPHPIRLLSPAKINLFLHVTGRRADGYHTLSSLMCCVRLVDEMVLSVTTETGISVACDHPAVPEDATNLAARAAALFLERMGIRAGVRVAIEKRIPVGAGLGGGSSNAATVLTAMNRHYGSPFTLQQLMSMGLSLGADIPFFIHGKPAMVSGIGERVAPVDGLPPLALVLIFPGVGISTATVYKNLNLALTNCKNKHSYSDLSELKSNVAHVLCNDLEPVAVSLCPAIRDAKEALLGAGATGAVMSGSGSAVFGIFRDAESALRVAADLSRQQLSWRVYPSEMIV